MPVMISKQEQMTQLFDDKQIKTFSRGSTATIKVPIILSCHEGTSGSKLKVEFYYEVKNGRGVLQW